MKVQATTTGQWPNLQIREAKMGEEDMKGWIPNSGNKMVEAEEERRVDSQRTDGASPGVTGARGLGKCKAERI